MEDTKSNSGQNLGIAALITAIITFVMAVIPCLGMIAFVPGILAIVLAAVGLSQASRTNSPRGVLVAGLVIGVVAVFISFSQYFVAGNFIRNTDKWPSEIRDVIDEVKTDVLKDLEGTNIDIRINSNGDSIEIKARSDKKEVLVKTLEDLEGVDKQKNDSVQKSKK